MHAIALGNVISHQLKHTQPVNLVLKPKESAMKNSALKKRSTRSKQRPAKNDQVAKLARALENSKLAYERANRKKLLSARHQSGEQRFDVARTRIGLFDALLRAAAENGKHHKIAEDIDRKLLSYHNIIQAAFALGGKIAKRSRKGEAVGVLLPTGLGAVVVFFALHAFGRIPAMLNFTAGIANLQHGCDLAEVKTILTARRFVENGKLEHLIEGLERRFDVVFLEDVRAKINLFDKLGAAFCALFPKLFRARLDPDAPGVVLFTSGTMGTPRGVLLSHANVVANVEQATAHIAFEPDWIFFNPLPVFHCFGLTAGMLLPLLSGHRVFLYPTPLHYKQIPPLIRECGANVLLATDTFASHYARSGNPDDLANLRLAVLGAERVKDETRFLFTDKLGVTVLEGYGATEAAPILAVNQPQANMVGSVGKMLPGVEWRLEPVEGLGNAGRLFVRGPNIMKGYLIPGSALEADPLVEGWHDTGDVVHVSADGFITILGRLKRFAKIGGEMVSLTASENVACGLWPQHRHAVVSLPCHRKGEKLVLVTDFDDADLNQLVRFAQSQGAPEIAIPKKIVKVPMVPVLGSGKTDYGAVEKIAVEETQEAA